MMARAAVLHLLRSQSRTFRSEKVQFIQIPVTYPPSLHAPLLSSPEPLYPVAEQAIGYPQDPYYRHLRDNAPNTQRQVLDEVEIRELLIDHVGHRCCWGSPPARTWSIHAVEDCNVCVGTLETFSEERETITAQLGVWELDLRSEFPVLFTPDKESRTIIPCSEDVEKCIGCGGRGNIVCTTCNADQEPGVYKENRMSQCPACYGRGLIAHQDGSDTICKKCNGKGNIPCATCGSRGLIKCETCQGGGSLLTRQVAIVRWYNVSPTRGLRHPQGNVCPDVSGVFLLTLESGESALFHV